MIYSTYTIDIHIHVKVYKKAYTHIYTMYINHVLYIKVTIRRIYSNTSYILDVLKTLYIYIGRIYHIYTGRIDNIQNGRTERSYTGRTHGVDDRTDRGGV